MIVRKTVRNLKGGNETRGQVRRRLKFRPIFCPFFSFSLSPRWLLGDSSSLSHSTRFPLFSPSAHARAYIIFANFSLPLYRESQSHPIVLPIFHPLPLFSINRKSLISSSSSQRTPTYAHPSYPPFRPSSHSSISSHPPQPPCSLPRLTGRVLFLFYLSCFPSEILKRENDWEPSLLIPWRVSSPSAIPVPSGFFLRAGLILCLAFLTWDTWANV